MQSLKTEKNNSCSGTVRSYRGIAHLSIASAMAATDEKAAVVALDGEAAAASKPAVPEPAAVSAPEGAAAASASASADVDDAATDGAGDDKKKKKRKRGKRKKKGGATAPAGEPRERELCSALHDCRFVPR